MSSNNYKKNNYKNYTPRSNNSYKESNEKIANSVDFEDTKIQEPELENLNFVIVANCNQVNFRKSPSKESNNILFEASVGTEFVLLEEDGDWTRVKSLTIPSTEGFIMSQFLRRLEK
jgi:hypothetical protein